MLILVLLIGLLSMVLNPSSGLLGMVADQLDPPTGRWYNDPVGWIRQYVFIWSKQEEICLAVRDHRYTAVRACHGPGKSFIAAWIVAWWLSTHEDAVVITSAPSANQVKNILWKEIGRAHTKAGLPGYITQSEIPEWKIGGEVVAFGRKPADYVDPEKAATAFQGIHAKHVLVVLDEGSGIPTWLANATEALVTNELSRVLMIGNPTDPKSYFAKVQRPNGGYHTIRISAWDCPWNTGEKVPQDVADRLVSEMWVEERRKRWGEGSILWMARVEAEFPNITEDTLFTPSILAKGFQSDRSRYAVSTRGNCGMDVARYGADETVVYHNRQGYVRIKGRWAKLDLMETVGRFRALWVHPSTGELQIPGAVPTCQVDVGGGLGAGPYDRLRELGYPVVPFNGGESAYNKSRYKNRRAEAYWEAKDAVDSGIVDVDEADEELLEELMETKFKYTSTGLIQIEDKDEIHRRLGRSPDRADAFVQSLQEVGDWAKVLGVESGRTEGIRPIADREPSAEELVRDVMDVQL